MGMEEGRIGIFLYEKSSRSQVCPQLTQAARAGHCHLVYGRHKMELCDSLQFV